MILQELKFGALQIYLLNTQEVVLPHDMESLRPWFSQADFESIQSIKNEKRIREFVAVRYMLFHLGFVGMLSYENKIPKLKNGKYISISHSGAWVVLALCDTFNVGVDVERVQEKIARVYEKFIHPEERHIFNANNDESSTLLWSFKETVYKLMQTDGLSFSEQICVKTDAAKNYKAEIFTTRGNFEVSLGHHKLGDYVLTFNTANVQKTK